MFCFVGCPGRFLTRRLYFKHLCMQTTSSSDGHFQFGPYILNKSVEVFYTSKLAYGIVNLKPIVPGHVLVISKRVVPRFQDLTEEEVFDLWLSAQRIGTHLESFYQAQSMTYCIQDGKAAGQSVPHVHIHIIPRRFGDFERTDQVLMTHGNSYELLEKKDSSAISSTAQKWRIEDAEDQRPSRTEEEMQREAQMLCELFASPNVT